MNIKCILISLITNFVLTATKIIFGIISKSKTLIADGVHSLSDMSTDIIGLIGTKIASKAADKNHPYGHGKAEYLTSIFISIIIFYLAYTIFVNSFSSIKIIKEYYILIISIFSIIIKYIVSSYIIKKGKQINSSILITSGIESRYDCISGAVAAFFILLSFFSENGRLLKYADTIGSIVIALLTLKIGIQLFVTNFKSAMGEVDNDKSKNNKIKELLIKYNEIKHVRRITILKYGSYSSVTLELDLDKNLNLEELYKLETKLKKEIKILNSEYKYVTINVRPYLKE